MSERSAPTISDVADAADVSDQTVSRVLNNSPLVKEASRTQVLEAIHNPDHHADPAAQALGRFRKSPRVDEK